MIERIIGELGPWNWVAIGLVLLVLEIAIPGVFLLWFGLAAIIVGVLSVMFANAAFWPWEAQILVFLMLALVLAFYGKRMMDKGDVTDEPLLNKRSATVAGPHGDPVRTHRRRLRPHQAWRHDLACQRTGPAIGAKVKVMSVDGNELAVEAA